MASWRVDDRAGKPLRASSGTYVMPSASRDVEALVAAHRLALGKLGADIASALDTLAASRR